MKSPWTIIGDGLAGCVLALACYREQIPFRWVSEARPGAASLASSGLINPITGRRYVKSWMADTLLAEASAFYTWSESVMDVRVFRSVEIARFLSSAEAIDAWRLRVNDPDFTAYVTERRHAALDSLGVPYGIVAGAFVLDTPAWVRAVRTFLQARGYAVPAEATTDAHSDVKGPVIRAVGVFADPLPHGLVPNNGEALIVRMPKWPLPMIVKGDVFVVPLPEPETYWIGSGYARWPANHDPTEAERERLLSGLRKLHDGPIEVIDHLAGIRPTTADRRPLIGADPTYAGDFIFNGMGTKGTSLAPYWAKQLIRHIRDGHPLSPEVDPARFTR